MLDSHTNQVIFAVVDRVADVIPLAALIASWKDLHLPLELSD